MPLARPWLGMLLLWNRACVFRHVSSYPLSNCFDHNANDLSQLSYLARRVLQFLLSGLDLSMYEGENSKRATIDNRHEPDR